ncbi:MAG: efflux RND transporter periplasmic adaptor subunit [Spirochaetales bacterium]|nr:MAG: efflux RND transporter periplasmic adaptor subunit [Spirochaetales bacterium]
MKNSGVRRIHPRSAVRAAGILSALFLAGCESRQTGGQIVSLPGEPLKAAVFEARISDVTPELSGFGSLSFISKTDLSPAVEGILKSLPVDEGGRVEPGMLLAEIENTQLLIRSAQADTSLIQARAGLDLAEARYNEGLLQAEARIVSAEKLELTLGQKSLELGSLEVDLGKKKQLLAVDGVTGDQVLKLKLSIEAARTDYQNTLKDLEILRIGYRDKDITDKGFAVPSSGPARRQLLKELNCLSLKAEVDVARAGIDTAGQERESVDLLLGELRIISPGRGVLGARYLEEGERITPGTLLFTIFADDRLYAVFPVQEKQALLVREDQDVLISLPAVPGEERAGRVVFISPMIDPKSGNLMVKALVENPGGELKPGMFVRVRVIHGRTEKRIILPLTSLTEKAEGKAFVFVAAGGRVFRRAVVTGGESSGGMVILEGLKEGELVVDKPSLLLKEGERVSVE